MSNLTLVNAKASYLSKQVYLIQVCFDTCYEGMEDEAWGRSKASHMHIAQAVEQMTLSRCGEAESTRSKQGAISGSEGADRYGERH